MAISQKVKQSLCYPAIPPRGIYPKGVKAGIQTVTCTPMFIAVLWYLQQPKGGINPYVHQQLHGLKKCGICNRKLFSFKRE